MPGGTAISETNPEAPDRRDCISIVIPARNAATTIGTLLRSLVADIGLIREILLVDDRSEDATVEIAQDTAQRCGLPLRVLPVTFGKTGAARNFGSAHARGRFLFFVDADDELVPGALTILARKLIENPAVGLAVGACIRRTANRRDKIKIPHGYTADCGQNVTRYLANELWPIAMGSALFVTACAAGIRFPETIGLDEDTCYWAALLARVRVVTTAEPVLLYKLDESRMARRYAVSPRSTLLGISRAFRALATNGVPVAALKQRVAWVALRIARQLIINRRYEEADDILRLVRKHPRFCSSWNVFRYGCRIQAGRLLRCLGIRRPLAPPQKLATEKPAPRSLIVTVDAACPPVSGADLRNFQNAAAAAKLGQVKLVSLKPSGSETARPVPGLEAVSVGVAGDKSPAISSWRCSLEVRISRACLQRLITLVREFRPDTVIVEGVPMTALLKHLRPLSPLLILDMHNVESALATRRPKPGGICGNGGARIQRLERKALKQVDRVWVCSEADRQRLMELHRPAVEVQVVPNGVPRSKPLQNDIPRRECGNTPVLLFVGHLGYWPNVAAAERLARGILPRVREAFPAAKAILAGRYPKPAVQALAAVPGVELHANPEDLAPLYARAHIVVVPLAEGGGTRIKILEALAASLPVVATTIAVEGLGLVANEEVRVADSDEALARHVIELCRNPDAGLRQVCFAEKTARLRFGPQAVDFAIRQGVSLAMS